ncbi:MAG: ABC transporter permease [Thermoleophilia bacterium]|nr:ABC transporter permease [Thermoleophilia bacterium]MDQ3857174.1 ABC transporter permease [Actinomycetota bacterium]
MEIAASRFGKGVLKGIFALLVLFLYAPLLILLLFSFNDNNLPVFPLKGFTTDAYHDFIANHELRAAVVTSAKVATASSAIAVALGVVAAIVLVRREFFAKPAVSVLLLSPLVVPLIALAIGLLVFLNRVPLLDPGLRAIVAGHVVLSLPYAILILAPRLERIDVRLEEAARDLGATPFRTFRSVTLPLIMPAIVSSFLVAFTISFDEIVIASFVNGDATTFPLYLFSQLRFPTLLPQVMAVAVVVMFASVLLLLAAEIGRRVVERRLGTEPSPLADAA